MRLGFLVGISGLRSLGVKGGRHFSNLGERRGLRAFRAVWDAKICRYSVGLRHLAS